MAKRPTHEGRKLNKNGQFESEGTKNSVWPSRNFTIPSQWALYFGFLSPNLNSSTGVAYYLISARWQFGQAYMMPAVFVIFHTKTRPLYSDDIISNLNWTFVSGSSTLSGAIITIDAFSSTAYHKLGDTTGWLWAFWDSVYELPYMEWTTLPSLSLTYSEKVGDTISRPGANITWCTPSSAIRVPWKLLEGRKSPSLMLIFSSCVCYEVYNISRVEIWALANAFEGTISKSAVNAARGNFLVVSFWSFKCRDFRLGKPCDT